MRRAAIIEGIVLIVLGLIGAVEAIRLIIDKASQTVQDVLGAGPYVLVVSIPLIVVGLLHVFSHRRIPRGEGEATVNREMRMRILLMTGTCALYILLISVVGYLLATFLFFLLEFKVVGVKSWRTNLIVTASMGAAYYIVFIKLCDLIFPRGIIFQ
jgi:hypothetical protein